MKALNKYAVVLLLGLFFSYPLYQTFKKKAAEPLLALLVPQSSLSQTYTDVWMSAAREEGIPLTRYSSEDLLKPFRISKIRSKGIILPDQLITEVQAPLLATLQDYVKEGGKLVIVGDALSQDSHHHDLETLPVEKVFEFPHVLREKERNLLFRSAGIQISNEWIEALRIAPGQYTDPVWENPNQDTHVLSTYQQRIAPYPYWPTESAKSFKGKIILESIDGSLVAGTNAYGKGEVLWINMPLGYLKTRTDGLLLHSFLRWISEDWIGLPRLLSSPEGKGGMVLNIHVDSNAAIPGLQLMKKYNLFAQGPFSIHVTAGPDARQVGDHLGFDLQKNSVSQDWVRYWVKEGHEVGAHGGWIHDFFGYNIKDSPNSELEDYLEKNRALVSEMSQKPVKEYSAPLGNHPAWVTQWLEAHDYNSYYFTGNSGLGPTQTFRDLVKTDHTTWAFPAASYRNAASFEEANQQKIPSEYMTAWLESLSSYVSRNHAIRLFYFHPPGVAFYPLSLKRWMEYNEFLTKDGKFKWYTMSQAASFLNDRSATQWSIQRSENNSDFYSMKVLGRPNLIQMTWTFPKKYVKQVRAMSGETQIKESDSEFTVSTPKNENFEIEYEEAAR